MSWLVAPRWTRAGVLLADPRADRTDEWLDRIAGGASLAGKRVAVVELDSECADDRGCGRLRHEPRPRVRVEERALRVEQRLEPGPIATGVRQLVGDEDRRERAHIEKKTVSSVPCM